MVKQKKLDKTLMKCAVNFSKLSYSKRKKVGAIIHKDNNIISYGWNGTPSGFKNKCEYINLDGEITTKDEVLHAESNAIAKAAISTIGIQGSTIYTTTSPCLDCSKLIIQAKIARVVYKDSYRDLAGIKLLKKAGIEVSNLNEENCS